MSPKDPFDGNWTLNIAKSRCDPNHRPAAATMSWRRTQEGYQMTAQGTMSDGQTKQERPAAFILDGKEHPVEDVPGCTAVMSRPVPDIIEVESKSAGNVVGKARYVVSDEGATLTASVSSVDAQQRRFETCLVWDRQ